MKLYELTGAYNEIFDLLESEDDLDYAALEDTLQSIEGVAEHKIGGIVRMILSLQKFTEAFDSEAKRLAKKKKTVDNRIKWLKDYMLQSLEVMAKDKIQTDVGTVSRRKSPPSVLVSDVNKIPANFWHIPTPDPQLDKKAVLEDLKLGKNIPGAEIKQSYHIRIY